MTFITAVRAFTILFIALFPFAALAQDTIFNRAPLESSAGSEMHYEAWVRVHPLSSAMREDFTIKLREIWPGGVSFQYWTTQKVLGDSAGMQTLSSLDECKSLDPWWDPAQTASDSQCQLWIPRKLFVALVAEEKGYLAVDTLMRHDLSVKWELVGRVKYLCKEDGRMVLVNALHVKTNRNDEFIILDDVNNPLILSADSQYFGWKLISMSNEQ